MLRKVGFLFALMLTVPALANAWTLAAKATAGGTISDGTTSVAAGSSKYITEANGSGVTLTVTPAAGYKVALVTVDGVAKAAPYTVAEPVAPKTTRTVVAYFSPETYSVTLTQPAGGSVAAQVWNEATNKGLGSISRTGIANLKAGAKVKIKALPNADYKVLTVAGVAKTAGAGVPQEEIITVAAGANAYTATFELVPVVKANLIVLTTDNKPVGTNLVAGTTVKLDAGLSKANGAITYAWAGCGAAGTDATATITPAADCTATVTVTSNGVSQDASLNLTVQSAQTAANNVCLSCHDNRETLSGIVTQYADSQYQIGGVKASCQDCHTAAAHTQNKCSDCHSSAQSHAFAVTGPTVSTGSCIACHDVAIKHPGSYGDNNGVRAITTEFAKWSHHVTGVALNDAHCAACHLEGKVEGGAIVVDNTKHMANQFTHLRNADTDADFAWDPANPDHTGMDNYCMSCHDENGATSAMSAQIQAFINANGIAAAGKTASASNPFGDTISNRYDKMQRPAVVDAKGQFNTANPSHHAVMGQKYSGRTRVEGAPRQASAAFAANSSATLPGVRSTIYDSRVKKTSAGTGPNAPYNVSKFVETYETLSPAPNTTDKTLGDDSILHCGDCHTVGQYRAADVGVLPKNAAVIGAHGSNNEYLLRNSLGTDERHVGQTYSSAAGINTFTNPTTQPWLVCFNCHSYQAYGSIGNATGPNGTNHAGEYANSNRCNGPVNTISFIGYTTSVNDTHEPYMFRLGYGQRDGITTGTTSTSDTDFSNLFGIQCANCHNAGPNNLFGGIHGAKVQSYTDANGAQQAAYRFLPGLGNTMFVPGSAAGVGSVSDLNWEVKSISTKYDAGKTTVVDNGGCYTIVPGEGTDKVGNADFSVSPAFEQTVDQPAPGTHIFGTWGGCDDHRGNAHGKAFATSASGYTDGTVPTGGAGVTRKVLRPVTY